MSYRVSATLWRACVAGMVLLALSACGARQSPSPTVSSRGSYKVGTPYTIDGTTYTPREEFQRVETGVASWYGPGFHAKSTANGEQYDQNDHTAAHRTLQMPSVLRVTNLDNGRSTVVRVNDRGPYARNRILDLSKAAAEDLDMMRSGTARIRLEQMQAESLAVKDIALAGGGLAEQREAMTKGGGSRRAPAPVTAIAAAPTPTPAPASASGFFVQTGAFSTAENAERQRGLVRSYGLSEIFQASAGGRDVFRVRLGPYTTADAAGIVADRLKRSGYGEARVVAD